MIEKKKLKERRNIMLDTDADEKLNKLSEYYGVSRSAAISMSVKKQYYDIFENKFTSEDIKKIISQLQRQL